ncbi:BTAD domain-containing putative transcriptional regulator [Saccharopolyspora sp. NPDC002686]|uniref:AfsR/SARP family transcriptional regulator n=1 Tax=Saccharopolyspora sp. NPDC002686 TaxID=3154541 RepID=UPI0033239080
MGPTPNGAHVTLLGDFELAVHGERIKLPRGAERLIAFLALHDNVRVPRIRVAEELWPDNSLRRALANVRSALCQGHRCGDTTIIERDGARLGLEPSVSVDLREILDCSQRINDEGWCGPNNSERERLIAMLGSELLPSWTDDWLALERQRWDQVRLHTLETFARELLASEHFLGVMHAALSAIAIASMRETAHRVLIEIYLAEGNPADAVAHYRRYRASLQRELGLSPSPRITRLVSGLFPSRRP